MDQPATLRSILQRGVVICLPFMGAGGDLKGDWMNLLSIGFKIDQSDFRFPVGAFPPCR